MNMIYRVIDALSPVGRQMKDQNGGGDDIACRNPDLDSIVATIKINGILNYAALNESFKAALIENPKSAIRAVGLDMEASELDLLTTSLQAQKVYAAGASISADAEKTPHEVG